MINLTVANWAITIQSNAPEITHALSSYLSDNLQEKSDQTALMRSVEINIDINSKKSGTSNDSGNQHLSYDLPQFQYTRRIDFERCKILVGIGSEAFTDLSHIYHLGFLFPFSYLLRKYRSTLVHAALVSNGEEGILIVGKSGAGKSSLSIALAHAGYTLYSDEHPLLKFRDDIVIGERFIGTPSLRSETYQFLKNVGVRGCPVNYKQKYKITDSLNRNRDVQPCIINTILYPEYSEDTSLECSPIRARDSFELLCKDDYLALPQCADHDDEKKRRQFHVELLLALSSRSRSYHIRYNKDGLARLIEGERLPL